MTHTQRTEGPGLLQRTADLLSEWTGCDVTLDTSRLTDARVYSGECYAVYATIGDVHVEDWYNVAQADAYEAEGRGDYARFLANELLRRYWMRVSGAPVAAIEIEDAEDEHVHETEATL
jgi:hypothetical protein